MSKKTKKKDFTETATPTEKSKPTESSTPNEKSKPTESLTPTKNNKATETSNPTSTSQTGASTEKPPKRNHAFQILFDRWKAGTLGEMVDDWRWIMGYSAKHKWMIGAYLFLGLFSSTMGIVSARINAKLVDVITSRDTNHLLWMIVLSVGMMLFSLIFSNLINRISTKLSVDMNNDIQADIFDSIVDADWMAIGNFRNGDIVNRFNGDVANVSGNAISWLPTVIMALYSFFLTLGIMWSMDPMMAVLAFTSAPFTLAASRLVLGRQRAYGKKVREMTSEMMGFEMEAFYNLDTIKSFGIGEQYNHKLHKWQKKYRKQVLNYNWFTIKTNIYMAVVGYMVSSLCFFYCLWRLWNGMITYGDMTFFLTQRSSLTSAFHNVIGTVPTFLNASISAHRIKELVELPEEKHIDQSMELDKYASHGFTVRMDDVKYAYVEDQMIIQDSDFIAKPGEIVALVGPSGEGKTTMIRLLLGLIHPEEGRSYLRAIDNSEVEMNVDTRHLFSYVPQGNTILSGTVAENLRMVKPEATDDEIIEALKIACAWDFIKKHKDTIYASIGERGKGFSEGQTQRIAIARAVLRDAPILLLDEATSALDVATEREVLRNIMKRRPNKTCIVTTHRPSVLNMCQRVYRVMDTRVTELSEEESARMAMDF